MDSSDDESDPLHKLLNKIQAKNMTASHVVLALLKDPDLREHALSKDLVSRTKEVLSAFETNPHSRQSTLEWANTVTKTKYAASIRAMSDVNNGWHFGNTSASQGQVKEFKIEEMAETMEEMAPEIWDLLGMILSADHRQTQREKPAVPTNVQPATRDADGDETMAPPETPELVQLTASMVDDDVDIEGASNPNSRGPKATRAERRHALETIVSYTELFTGT